MVKKDIKSTLRSGMLVEDRKGRLGMVMLGTPKGDVIVGDGTDDSNSTPSDEISTVWSLFINYSIDLNHTRESEFDIVKVYDTPREGYPQKLCCLADMDNKEDREVLWERIEPKKISINGVEHTLEDVTKAIMDLAATVIEDNKEAPKLPTMEEYLSSISSIKPISAGNFTNLFNDLLNFKIK